MSDTAERVAGKRFFSLKWKAMLLLSLVLVLISGSFSFLSYRNLRHQYEHNRQSVRARQEQLLRGLLTQSAGRLRQIGSLIPDLGGVREAMAASDAARAQAAFDRYWSEIQLDSGLDQVRLYGRNSGLLGRWGDPGHASEEKMRRFLVAKVSRQEAPADYLQCSDECIQDVVVPVMAGGRHVGAVLAAASLADVIVAFRQTSGSDIGVLVTRGPGHSPTAADERVLPLLNARVLALSGPAHNLLVLQNVPQMAEPAGLRAAVKRVRLDGRDYEIGTLPMQFVSRQSGNGYFVLVSDITDALAQIHRATWRNLAAGGLGLLLSEVLLVGLLWPPMSRLRRTALTLPRLGQGAFGEVRAVIRSHSGNRRTRDEIDLLDGTAIELADRLEGLQSEVSARTDALADTVEALSRERDFATGLVNTVQVMIVTQNAAGRVVMANGYAQDLTGYTEEDLVGTDFFERFAIAEQSTELRAQLAGFLAHGEGHLRRESILECKDGTVRNVVWVHSRLGARLPGDPVLLSAGLDITELRQAKQQASFLADYDPLTALLNRRRFQEELSELLQDGARQGDVTALLCFDIDEFKYVNDSGGHELGDALLRAVARELQQLIPSPRLAARLGGDEFAAVFHSIQAAEAIQIARSLNQRIGEIELPGPWRTHKVSASIGIALSPEHGGGAEELLAHGNLALAQAREKGRGSWHLYSPKEQLMERMVKRGYWVEKIEQALAEDRFELHYQPIMGLHDNCADHYEALVRMRMLDGTLVPPGDFIGVAEATGLIRAIDRVVLRKAILKLAELKKENGSIKLSVNLSGRSFEGQGLVEILKEQLGQLDVDPAKLIFEITETAAVEDFEAARTLMQAVQQLGCAFALDDFGVGFSSFHYVKNLPVDYVKIDGSFVRNLAQSRDDQVFVKVLVQAAKGFGKKTVAEFVENGEILALLREYGVDYAQGYFIGRPADHTRPVAPLKLGL